MIADSRPPRGHVLARVTLVAASLVASAGAGVLVGAADGAASTGHSLINGSGSSWSSNAVSQWVADVQSQGLQVVFTASGSAQGRKDFAYKTTDFAVSDIGFQGVDPRDPTIVDDSQGRAFAYLPVVAGGTSFPYHVEVGGKLLRTLRLSGTTLARIFTNQITNWNDPAISADNNGRKLPSIPIIPVVHSEGSGSTAQFTRYLDTVHPNLWRPFGGSGLTEYYPRKAAAIAQNGSDGVMNFISASAGNGSIGYDEYSYALGKNYPVAKILNTAGYFTLPNQYNVAVALTKAQINMDKTDPNKYLLQNLDQVYTYNDPRVYPLSSYSYMIIPTSGSDPKMTTTKRQTLADYLTYSVCEGQKEMGPIGYSPLPINLVQASFDQTKRLKTADAGVSIANIDVTKCNNPTFDPKNPKRNYLSEVAPMPAACDKTGAGPCTGVADTGTKNPTTGPGSKPGSTGSGSTPGTGQGSTGGTTGGTTPGTTGKPGSTTPSGGTGGTVPSGGQQTPGDGTGLGTTGSDSGTVSAADIIGTPTEIAAVPASSSMKMLAPIMAALLVFAVLLPPLLSRRFRARGSSR